jgi:hypothetical protein
VEVSQRAAGTGCKVSADFWNSALGFSGAERQAAEEVGLQIEVQAQAGPAVPGRTIGVGAITGPVYRSRPSGRRNDKAGCQHAEHDRKPEQPLPRAGRDPVHDASKNAERYNSPSERR